MSKLSSWRTIFFLCVFCAATAIASPAQTFKTLVSFNGTDGRDPNHHGVVQGTDGNFYGTTAEGGVSSACSFGCGTVFKITPGGTLTTLHSFDGRDGSFPIVASAQAQISPLAIGGSGTTNYIPIWTNSKTLGNSLLYQTGGNVGIGNTSPAGKLDVSGPAISRGNLFVFNGNLNLQGTTGATAGVINLAGIRFIHECCYVSGLGYSNTFVGLGAGNFTSTGGKNTSLAAIRHSFRTPRDIRTRPAATGRSPRTLRDLGTRPAAISRSSRTPRGPTTRPAAISRSS